MNRHLPTRLLLAALCATALGACGSDHDDHSAMPPAPGPAPAPPAMSVGELMILTASNRLASVNRDAPATIRTSVPVTGLQTGENLVGIDFRPADGMLYGVGSTGRIYTIDMNTGAATLKSRLAADSADTSAPFAALAGTEFAVDFNPVADRLRVVGNTGQNLRINIDTGATTTDGDINGGAANGAVTAAAYTNSFAGTASTTLYVIDSASDTLYIQNPPNNGTLASPVALGLDAGAMNGFDIDARSNAGYAVLSVGGVRTLYSVSLSTTATPLTAVGALGVTEDVRGIALRSPAAPTVVALADTGRLLSFKAATPNTIDSNLAVTGLTGSETLLGIDFRPKDGLLYGITSAGRIVTIDTATGAATAKSTLVADPADTSQPYTAVAGTAFAVDFNPVADRLRVIGNGGQSLRINVDSGATTTDGAVNRSGATPSVTAAAYTNSYAGTTATALYDIDTASASLALQNPPNDGTLATVGMLGVSVTGDLGFDIAGGANGLALAALRSTEGGPSTLYRIDLATGAATPANGAGNPALSAIGGNLGVRDIAISLK